jgi:hypothetical protein
VVARLPPAARNLRCSAAPRVTGHSRECPPDLAAARDALSAVTADAFDAQLQPGVGRTVWRPVPKPANATASPLLSLRHFAGASKGVPRSPAAISLAIDPDALARVDAQSASGSPELPAALEQLLGRWDGLPAKYKLIFATSLSFCICNMVRGPTQRARESAVRHQPCQPGPWQQLHPSPRRGSRA